MVAVAFSPTKKRKNLSTPEGKRRALLAFCHTESMGQCCSSLSASAGLSQRGHVNSSGKGHNLGGECEESPQLQKEQRCTGDKGQMNTGAMHIK